MAAAIAAPRALWPRLSFLLLLALSACLVAGNGSAGSGPSSGGVELIGADPTDWWKHGVIYQVYPRSFLDGCSPSCTGTGSLRGITSKLRHLRDLGVTILWLSPIYDSPMADFGYDISNFTGVWPLFGDVEDVRALVSTANQLGLRVLLDFVPNHSSNQHPWFLESRNAGSAKRDWYIWRKGSNGGPPNNWRTLFCKDINCSAWEFDEASGEYYYHNFLKEQPDLNWRSPELIEAMHEAMRFWLDLGVSGFRVDAPIYLLEDPLFRDEPRDPNFHGDPLTQGYSALLHTHTENQDGVHGLIRGMQAVLQEYGPGKMMIGEVYGDPVVSGEDVLSFYGTATMPEFNMPFNMNLVGFFGGSVDSAVKVDDSIRNATKVREAVSKYYASLPGAWAHPNFVLGNHDIPRVRRRTGGSEMFARGLMVLLLTLRGTPTMYNGDEIGMLGGYVPESRAQDPTCIVAHDSARCRDPERTPLQWTADQGPNAGFTGGDITPWLPVSADYVSINVADQLQDEDSFFALTAKVLKLRQGEVSLHAGDYSSFACGSETVLCFLRSATGSVPFIIAINLGRAPAMADASAAGGGAFATGKVAVDSLRPGSAQPTVVQLSTISLEAEQSFVIELSASAARSATSAPLTSLLI